MNALIITLLAAAIGHGHILGNDTIAHFSIINIHSDRIELDFMLDIGETLAIRLHTDEIDLDHDDNDTMAEQEAWLAKKSVDWAQQLHVTLDNHPIPLEPVDQLTDPHTGRTEGTAKIFIKTPSLAGMWTYKVIIRYVGAFPSSLGTSSHRLAYKDTTFPNHPGMMRVLLGRSSLLFRIRNVQDFKAQCEAHTIPPLLRELFQQKGIALSDSATLTDESDLNGWLLVNDQQRYSVEYEEDALNVHQLPRAVIDLPRPQFWDESPVSPFLYDQYDLNDLPQQRSATISFHLTGIAAGIIQASTTQPLANESTANYLAALNDPRNDPQRQGTYRRDAARLIDLLQQPMGIPLFATITVLCFGWGAAHALMPGHAKTLVAAYLISQRGNWQHAVYLAIIVTLTHTALVIALGLTLWFYQTSNPTVGIKLQMWLGTLAGILVAGMGLTLIWRAVTDRIGHHHHEHPCDDNRSWLRKLLTHSHPHMTASEHHHHHSQPHEHHHAHTHGQEHDHDHHEARPLTLRLLLMLGVTGGMVPCPTAAIIMLLGIGANVIPGALYAVAVFSLGLALTLMTIGFAALGSRQFATRLLSESPHSHHLSGWGHKLMIQTLPALSGMVVLLLGSAIATHYIYYLQTGSALFTWIQ